MRSLNEYFIQGQIDDISTFSATYVSIPDGGTLEAITGGLSAAITGTATLQFLLVSPLANLGSIVVVNADVSGKEWALGSSVYMPAGSLLSVLSDGGSTNVSTFAFSLVIRR